MSLVQVSQAPTSLAQVDDQCAAVEEWAEQCDDVPALKDAANKLAAIDEYLSRTSTDGRARVAAAMRRLESRIGEVIGPPDVGGDRKSDQFGRDRTDLSPDQRSEFRQMAANPDVVEDVIEQSSDDDPPSRRKVVNTIKQRSQPSPVVEWSPEERGLRARMESGDTVVANLRSHPHLIQWATANGRYERVDRRTRWGNPFEMPADGDRATVIDNYRDHYLPHKPSLIDHLGDLQGKALGCWCAPEPCHADVLRHEVDG